MYQSYRVMRRFEWRGWTFAPLAQSEDIPYMKYGGDTWIVEAGHPRLDAIIDRKFVVYDSGLADTDTLLKQECYSKLLRKPTSTRKHKKSK